MMFTIYPAIDLRGGQCVRLVQGDYDQETVYGRDPVAVAKRWAREGAQWLHLVDLDAARTGKAVNLPQIAAIVDAVDIPVQVGGGIRDRARIEQLFALGVQRLIVGSAAIDDVDLVSWALEAYGSRIAIGIDAKEGYVATHGWLQTSDVHAEKLAQQLRQRGARTFIFTDIARDGMLSGPNITAIRQFAAASGGEVIASGGVATPAHLAELKELAEKGVVGAIVGRALYTGDVVLSEAQEMLAKE